MYDNLQRSRRTDVSVAEQHQLGSMRYQLGARTSAASHPSNTSGTMNAGAFSTYRDPTKTIWDQADVPASFRSTFGHSSSRSYVPSSQSHSQSPMGFYGVPPGIPSIGLAPSSAGYGVASGMQSNVFGQPSSGYTVPGTSSTVFGHSSSG